MEFEDKAKLESEGILKKLASSGICRSSFLTRLTNFKLGAEPMIEGHEVKPLLGTSMKASEFRPYHGKVPLRRF